MSAQEQQSSRLLHTIGATAGILAALIAIVGTVVAGFAYFENTYAKKDMEEIQRLLQKYDKQLEDIKATYKSDLERSFDKYQEDIRKTVSEHSVAVKNNSEQLAQIETKANAELLKLQAFVEKTQDILEGVRDKSNTQMLEVRDELRDFAKDIRTEMIGKNVWKKVPLRDQWDQHDVNTYDIAVMKDLRGFVNLRGSAGASSFRSRLELFELPEEYRPDKLVKIGIEGGDSGASLIINPNGIGVVESKSESYSSSFRISLDGTMFPTSDGADQGNHTDSKPASEVGEK